jgi:hypothetical protein
MSLQSRISGVGIPHNARSGRALEKIGSDTIQDSDTPKTSLKILQSVSPRPPGRINREDDFLELTDELFLEQDRLHLFGDLAQRTAIHAAAHGTCAWISRGPQTTSGGRDTRQG